MNSIYIVLISLAVPTFSVYTGYTYGDHVSGHKWNAATPLAQYNNIANAAACETKCENYGTTCNNWAYRSSDDKCVIGKDGTITVDSAWTAGWNKNSCDDPLDCSQNTECNSYTPNDAFSVSGSKRTVTSNSNTRCYKAYVPSSCKDNANDKCKVVFAFSSFATNAISWANQRIDFTERITGEASSGGWTEPGIVIFPQRYAEIGGWHFLTGRAGLCSTYNDVKFVADILQNLEDNNVYWDKAYAMGYDNGGHFVYDLAGRLYDEENIALAAIGSYSGNSLTDHGGTVDTPSTPLSILIVQGYTDDVHPYWGHTSTGCDMGRDDSQSLADWWGQALNCDSNAVIDQCHTGTAPNCSGTNGEKKRHYTNCDNSVALELQSTNTGYAFTSAGDIAFPDFFNDH